MGVGQPNLPLSTKLRTTAKFHSLHNQNLDSLHQPLCGGSNVEHKHQQINPRALQTPRTSVRGWGKDKELNHRRAADSIRTGHCQDSEGQASKGRAKKLHRKRGKLT